MVNKKQKKRRQRTPTDSISTTGMLMSLVVLISGCHSLALAKCGGNHENTRPVEFNFTLSEGFASKAGSHSHHWRGYRFTVSYRVIVSALKGGATSDQFTLALFLLNAAGTRIEDVMAHAPAPNKVPGDAVELDTCIQLLPTERYYIAQGRLECNPIGTGTHYRVKNIQMSTLVSTIGFLATWEPEEGVSSLDFGSGVCGQPKDLLSMLFTGEDPIMPDIGLVAVHLPTPTLTASPSQTFTRTTSETPSSTSSETPTPSNTHTPSPTPTASPSSRPKVIQSTELPLQRPRRYVK